MTFEEIRKNLSLIDDPAMKLEAVMDIGKTLLVPPADAKCTEILGCASFVQICRCGNNFFGTADSMMVRGIVAIILSMVDGHTADEIRNMPLETWFGDLKINIGAARLNGVNSMIRFLKNL